MIKRTHAVPGRATGHRTWPERLLLRATLCWLGVAPLLLADSRAHAEPAEQAEGEETPATEQASRIPRSLGEGWNFELGTYFWASSLNGNATVAGQNLQIDASFIDVVQETDSLLALDLLFVARKERWGFLLDPWFSRAGGGATGPMGNDFDLTARMLIFETTGFYTFFQRAAGSPGKTTISIDAILGLRIWWMELSASGAGGLFSEEGSQAWVDPLAGMIFRFDLARGHVPIRVRGDFGGWGVGSSIAWGTTASVGYRWLLPRLDIGLDLAYRALGPKYSNSSKGIGWDVVMHGPAIAIVFGF